MAFRFNYTNRGRILLSEAEIRAVPGEPRLTVYLTSDFKAQTKYTATDVVVIEAYRFTKAQRVELGTVGEMPNKVKIVFDEFADALNVKYRLKIVDPETKRLKGLAKKVTANDTPEKPSDLEPILPVAMADAEDGLGDCFWKVAFPASANGPVLMLNGKKLSYEAVKSEAFKALAWPSVLEAVLTEICIVNAPSFPSWATKWMTFVSDILGVEGAPDEWDPEKLDFTGYIKNATDWIAAAKVAFSRHFSLASVAIKGLTKEDGNG